MGNSTSSTRPIVGTDDIHISRESPETTNFKVSDMAATLDAQMPQLHDVGQGTLMGLQELDSHLAIFECSLPSRDSSTPGAISDSVTDNAFDLPGESAHTIIVHSPDESYSHKVKCEASSLAKLAHIKAPFNKAIIAEGPPTLVSNGNLHLRPGSARNSMASSMVTEPDDASSALSSISSNATSPSACDTGSREKSRSESNSLKRRRKYECRPKVSIPTDIAPSEYARQCVAAAEASRLSPYSLHHEEHFLLRKHISLQQITTYLNIRNGILRLWTRNPLIGVMRDEAVGCAKDSRWFDVASICHEWLVRRGYINYGCLEHINMMRNDKPPKIGQRKRRTIAIIGAGMSGLGCARQLDGLVTQFEDQFLDIGEDRPRIIVLEGRDRIGGRVYSRAFKSKPQHSTIPPTCRHTAEMGGMIITGFDRGNPLNIIVRGQLALPYHALKPDTTLYDANGRPVDNLRDQHAEKLFNYILDRVGEYKFKIVSPQVASGDRTLIDAGRDSTGDGGKKMSDMETIPSSSTQTGTTPQSSAVIDNPVTAISSERLTGRVNVEPGVPAIHTAAYKAREIGWQLRPGVGIEYDLDLDNVANSKYATHGSVFDEAIRQYSRIVDFTPLDLRLINWHVANLEYSNAATVNKLSLGGWDLDAGNEWEGKHTMVIGGYQQVPKGLFNCPQPLDVRRKYVVKRVAYNPHGHLTTSKIECENGEIIEADYVVSTIPLGVLKQHKIHFDPPLPDWKTGAIQRIGFGILNKIILVFSEPFWDQGRDIIGSLRNPANRFSLDQKDYLSERGRFFQWFNCTSTAGLPALMALMAGDAASQTERALDEDLIFEATKVLRSMFGEKVSQPIEAVITRWGHDQYAFGSYSYTGPYFRPDDYEVMAKPVGNLFFAGEHTCGSHPATVHGAYISGLRAASEVLEAIIGPVNIPEPLVLPKDSSLKRKSETVQGPVNPRQARLQAYEVEIWNAIYTELGERPWRPANNYANPYRLFSKEKYDEARGKCEEGRRPGKGKPVPNEVKKMVTKMWKELSQEAKMPYIEKSSVQKKAYLAAMTDYNVRATKWDNAALDFRGRYEKEHPSIPGPNEGFDSPSTRDRRAKKNRNSTYAENSESDLDQ